MGRLGDFFYRMVIVVLIIAAIVFLAMAFKEQYPLWKNQQELENLQASVETETVSYTHLTLPTIA